jgi:hypothetical protein
MMKRLFDCPRLGWVVTLCVAAAGASVALGNAALVAAQVPAPEVRATVRHAETERTELLRQRDAEPGRASLLASPFGPMPRVAPGAHAAAVPTRIGLYATREHAEDIDGMMNGEVVWISLECCAADAVERALGTTYGLVAARNLPPDAPVFVDGEHAEPALTARLADRLSDAGLTRVFVLLP